jgi:mRNA interferase HigB
VKEHIRLRVITHRAIVEFSANHPNAASALDAWYRTIKADTFQNLAELKATFPSVDLIKATIYVFNIGGNTVRLVASIHFNVQRIYILAILTHAEYDKDKWK